MIRGDWVLRHPLLSSLARNAVEGLILEFGVAEGRSAAVLAESGRTVYGFDWFRGLPHDWGEVPKGSFACRPEVPDNVVLIEGLFSDTLEQFLVDHTEKVALVHMDADLYCPTLYVLNTLKDRFTTRSMIIFDEMCVPDGGEIGEGPAWERYRKENPKQRWRFAGKQHSWGEYWVRD